MDLPIFIKKDEPVEYFLISTQDEEITPATTLDNNLNATNLPEIHSIFIKEEPVELELEYTRNDQDDIDFKPIKSENVAEYTSNDRGDTDFVPCKYDSNYEEDENHLENDNGKDWSMEKQEKPPKTKLQLNSKLKFHKISTEGATSHGPPYTCNICSLSFPLKKALIIHQRIHKGKKFQCDICSKVYRHEKSILEHLRVHREPNYSCPICGKKYAIKRSWVRHQLAHEGKKLQCDICSRLFLEKGHIVEHMKVHRERSKQFKCEICHTAYYERRTLTRHIKRAHSNAPRKRFRCPNALCDKLYATLSSFKIHACVDGKRPEGISKMDCPTCGRSFFQKYTFEKHLKTHTNKSKNFKCDKCSRTFLPHYWDTYVLHIAQNCPDRPIYRCDQCPKVIRSKRKIIEHFADRHGIVSELMKLSCPECNKKFLYQKKLNFHLRKAHRIKWNCEYCGKKYPSASGCSLHQQFCLPKKTFDKYCKYVNDSDLTSETNECQICNRSFIKKVNLIEHMKLVHLEKKLTVNEKPMPDLHCSLCKKSFISRATLSRHKKLVHKDVQAFKCEKCKEEIIGANFYQKHLKVNKCVNANGSVNIQQYQCTVCSKIFARNSYLKRHFKQMHTEERIFYECYVCNRKFSKKETLIRHFELGDHRTSFQCEICLKSFQQIPAYKVHANRCKFKNQSKESAIVLK